MYLRPANLKDACEALASRPLTVLAGGTDHFPARSGHVLHEDILDITGLAELRGIGKSADGWRIGATATWAEVLRADLPPLFDGLKLAAREVGGMQIQNAGTVAGNVCNASPAADGVPALLALEASVELTGARGVRRVPLAQFIAGARKTLREADELVSAVLVPAASHDARSTFLKLGARKYLVISIAMAAIVLECEGRTVRTARIAVGSCSAVAQRLATLERDLIGKKLDKALGDIPNAGHFSALAPIDDVRATATYRMDAALTLVRRGLAQLGDKA